MSKGDYNFYEGNDQEANEVYYHDLKEGMYGFVDKEKWDFLQMLLDVDWKFGLGLPRKHIRVVRYWKKVLKPIKERAI